VDILVAYKTSMTSGGAGASAQLAISDNLKMLPVLVLGLLKNVSVFGGCMRLYADDGFFYRSAFVKVHRFLLIFVLMHRRC
jgi:hypothetical protein